MKFSYVDGSLEKEVTIKNVTPRRMRFIFSLDKNDSVLGVIFPIGRATKALLRPYMSEDVDDLSNGQWYIELRDLSTNHETGISAIRWGLE